MTLQQHLLNGTDGAAATSANTDGGAVQTGGTNAQTLRASAAYEGATGLEIFTDGTASSAIQWSFSATVAQASFSQWIRIPSATPSADLVLGYVVNPSGGRVVQIVLVNSNAIRTKDAGNNYITVLTTSQTSAAAGQWVEFKTVVTAAATAGSGAFTMRAYDVNGNQVGSTASTTTGNLGTTNIGGYRAGSSSSSTGAGTFQTDTVQMDDGRTTEIPSIVLSTPPTVAPIAATKVAAPGSSVSVTASATAAGGRTIASYSWSLSSAMSSAGAPVTGVTLSGSGTATVSLTPPTRGRYVLSVTATDSGGYTSSPVTAIVNVVDTAVTPIALVAASGWASTAQASLVDGSDSTYDESGAAGTGGVLVMALAPIVDNPPSFTVTVRSQVGAAGGSQTVELVQGATSTTNGTVRKSWGAISPNVGTMADQSLSLSASEIAAVTNWQDLALRFTQV